MEKRAIEKLRKIFESIDYTTAYFVSSKLSIPVKVLKSLKDKNDFEGFLEAVSEVRNNIATEIIKSYEKVFAFNLKLKENNIETPELDEILKKLYENECFLEEAVCNVR